MEGYDSKSFFEKRIDEGFYLEREQQKALERVKNLFEDEDVLDIIDRLLSARGVYMDMSGRPVATKCSFLVFDPWSERFLVLSHSPSERDHAFVYLYSISPQADVTEEDIYHDLEQVVDDFPNITMV